MTACFALALVGLAQADGVTRELVFPMNPLHNHSSCVVECPNGDLLVCWYRGSGERKADDVRILGARRRKGASGWSEPFVLADTPGYPDCNPVLFVDPKSRLWLIWPVILDHHWESALLKWKRSSRYSGDGPPIWEANDTLHVTPKDLGQALLEGMNKLPLWLAAAHPGLKEKIDEAKGRSTQELYQRLGWMPRCRPLALPGGRWILPLYCDTFSVAINVVVEPDDRFLTTGPILGFGAIQPSIAPRRDGSLIAFLRENGPRMRVRQSISTDGGMTWGPVTDTALPNPGSSVDVIRTKSGRLVMALNDTIKGRHRLSLVVSDDDGATWGKPKPVEEFTPEKGSASYPSILQTKDGRLHVTCSYRSGEPGSSIRHLSVAADWLPKAGSTPAPERPSVSGP